MTKSLLAESFLERNGTLFEILAAVLIAGVTGIVTWYFTRRNKATKTFDYRVVTNLPIVLNRPANDALKVTYQGQEVRNPRIVRVQFLNTGKQVIKAAEFLDAYFLRLNGSRLLDISITDESAKDLTTFISGGHEGWLQLNIRTLNPGDTFTVQMIVDSDVVPQVAVQGRVEGQTRATQMYPTKAELNYTRTWFTILAPFGVLLFLVGVIVAFFGKEPHSVWSVIGWMIAGGLTIGMAGTTWIVARRNLMARFRL